MKKIKKILSILIISTLLITNNSVFSEYYIPWGLDKDVNKNMPWYNWLDYEFVFRLITTLNIDESALNFTENIWKSDFEDTEPYYTEMVSIVSWDSIKDQYMKETLYNSNIKEFITWWELNTLLKIEHNWSIKRNPWWNKLGLFQNRFIKKELDNCKIDTNYETKVYNSCVELNNIYKEDKELSKEDVAKQILDLTYVLKYNNILSNNINEWKDPLFTLEYNLEVLLSKIGVVIPEDTKKADIAKQIANWNIEVTTNILKNNEKLFFSYNISNYKDFKLLISFLEKAIVIWEYKWFCNIDWYCDPNGNFVKRTNILDNYYITNYPSLELVANNNVNYKHNWFIPMFLENDKSLTDRYLNLFIPIAQEMINKK